MHQIYYTIGLNRCRSFPRNSLAAGRKINFSIKIFILFVRHEHCNFSEFSYQWQWIYMFFISTHCAVGLTECCLRWRKRKEKRKGTLSWEMAIITTFHPSNFQLFCSCLCNEKTGNWVYMSKKAIYDQRIKLMVVNLKGEKKNELYQQRDFLGKKNEIATHTKKG